MSTLQYLSQRHYAPDCAQIFSDLQKSPRQLPFYLFYDDIGSDLFRQITTTPEYYLTRVEKQILRDNAVAIVQACGPHRIWIEPGAGCCDKAAQLLQGSPAQAYVAIDISADALQQAADDLAQKLSPIPVHLLVGDFALDLMAAEQALPPGPRTVFYPGSSIGNFSPDAASIWLQQLARLAGDQGQMLIGFDLPKDPARLHAAYNDADGVTRAFHLNVLQHLSNLGFRLQAEHFSHLAFFNPDESRIEMHLQATQTTSIQWQQQSVTLNEGERILTEYSYKYSLTDFIALARNAGWTYRQHWHDQHNWFALALFERS